MRTIKLVVIGESGVGKTSLRTQYISGRFSTGYRATIGADFMAKSLPHYRLPDELVSLQIWDTAGQERFSALSTAFFRGADAVLLVFDVNRPGTLDALRRWWATFRDAAPVREGTERGFCVVLVGNKTDLGGTAVSSAQARSFGEELIPVPAPAPPAKAANGNAHHGYDVFDDDSDTGAAVDDGTAPEPIDIHIGRGVGHHPMHSRGVPSRATSRSRFPGGTMNTTRTGMSIYHTPVGSLFDETFVSAPSSPPTAGLGSRERERVESTASASSGPTITPMRARAAAAEALPEEGTRVFFASAKTGEGVDDIFAYVAERVVRRWDWEEAHVGGLEEESDDTVRVGLERDEGPRKQRRWSACCA